MVAMHVHKMLNNAYVVLLEDTLSRVFLTASSATMHVWTAQMGCLQTVSDVQQTTTTHHQTLAKDVQQEQGSQPTRSVLSFWSHNQTASQHRRGGFQDGELKHPLQTQTKEKRKFRLLTKNPNNRSFNGY